MPQLGANWDIAYAVSAHGVPSHTLNSPRRPSWRSMGAGLAGGGGLGGAKTLFGIGVLQNVDLVLVGFAPLGCLICQPRHLHVGASFDLDDQAGQHGGTEERSL